jgi:hypothetical protein
LEAQNLRVAKGFLNGFLTRNRNRNRNRNRKEKTLWGMAPPPPRGDDSSDGVTSQKKNPYPDDFEQAWAIYPKRSGGNSKADACKAWKARVKTGATVQELLDGTRRYAEFVRATGKLNTEYVKQAATF